MKKVFFAPNANPGTSFFEILKSIQYLTERITEKITVFSSESCQNVVPRNFLDSEQDLFQYYNDFGVLLRSMDDVEYLLFLDFFAPGLDILQYLLELKKKKIKIGALLHGASFLEGDLYKRLWLSQAEKVWGEIFDVIYVPSVYLFDQLPICLRGKARVFPRGVDYFLNLMNEGGNCFVKKDIDVLFPHRLSDDKGVKDFIKVVKLLPQVQFAVTSFSQIIDDKNIRELRTLPNCIFVIGHGDREHIKTLKRSKIVLSCANQENFGYSMIKAVLTGAIPVVPKRLVYTDFFPEEFCYQDVNQAVKKILYFLSLSSNNILLDDCNSMVLKFEKMSFYPLIQDFYELNA